MSLKNFDKVNYVPVLNGSVLNCAIREDLFINGKRATFYTKDGIYNYPKFLINPYHHDEVFSKIPKDNILDDSLKLADSGGLQEVNLGEKRHDPEEVFKWQQEHVDIGFSMDSIPFKNESGRFTGWVFDKANFIKHAEKSRENNNDCKKIHKRDGFLYYGIIQGRQYNEYLDWYNVIRDDTFIDGYCVKTPTNNPVNLAETIIFAINNITPPIHFLGVGNQSKALMVYYANKYLKQKITFDSSSYDIGTQFRSYLLPGFEAINGKARFVSLKNVEKDETCNKEEIITPDNLNDWCECIVCKTIGDQLPQMIVDNAPILGGMLSVHNLIMNIKWNNYIRDVINANNKKKLDKFINANFDTELANKIQMGIGMIDMAVERGPEYTFKHFEHATSVNQDFSAQKGIWDF